MKKCSVLEKSIMSVKKSVLFGKETVTVAARCFLSWLRNEEQEKIECAAPAGLH